MTIEKLISDLETKGYFAVYVSQTNELKLRLPDGYGLGSDTCALIYNAGWSLTGIVEHSDNRRYKTLLFEIHVF